MLNENNIKNNDTKLEEEVELLIKKSKKLEGQNNIFKKINEINEKYNLLKFEIDKIMILKIILIYLFLSLMNLLYFSYIIYK